MRKAGVRALFALLLAQIGLFPSPCTSYAIEASTLAQFQQERAACAAGAEAGCVDGKCPTSSCKTSGMGSTVMSCFGINIPQPATSSSSASSSAEPASNAATAAADLLLTPCAYLACVLDTSNCSTEPSKRNKLFGALLSGKPRQYAVGAGISSDNSADSTASGFCLGMVMAVGGKTAAELHPAVSNLVAYPCVEHRDPGLSLVPPSGASLCSEEDCPLPPGSYVARGWHVCNCKGSLTAGWPANDSLKALL